MGCPAITYQHSFRKYVGGPRAPGRRECSILLRQRARCCLLCTTPGASCPQWLSTSGPGPRLKSPAGVSLPVRRAMAEHLPDQRHSLAMEAHQRNISGVDNVADGSMEIASMNRTRTLIAASILAGLVGYGVAFAQAPAPAPAATPAPATTPAPAASGQALSDPTRPLPARVETWTRKRWEAAKKEWAADKTKWADCRKQSSAQKLAGRKSWLFLYNCMSS